MHAESAAASDHTDIVPSTIHWYSSAAHHSSTGIEIVNAEIKCGTGTIAIVYLPFVYAKVTIVDNCGVVVGLSCGLEPTFYGKVAGAQGQVCASWGSESTLVTSGVDAARQL